MTEHIFSLDNNLKLSLTEISYFKQIIDEKINPDQLVSNAECLKLNSECVENSLSADHPRLMGIPVQIIPINHSLLVKVGPCDLSGVGGHPLRKEIVKNLVNDALQQYRSKYGVDYTFNNVNVSACVGVRGRLQMVQGMFFDNKNLHGNHMNAYIKTEYEDELCLWEPRQGPQPFFNDTMCAVVISVTTSIFEKKIRDQRICDCKEATTSILRDPQIAELFQQLLIPDTNKLDKLLENINHLLNEPSVICLDSNFEIQL